MTDELRDLVDRLTYFAVEELKMERELRTILLAADEDVRSETAYYMHDVLVSRSDLQYVSFEKVERYIAHRIKLAEWHAKRDDALDEIDALVASMTETYFLADDDDDEGVADDV